MTRTERAVERLYGARNTLRAAWNQLPPDERNDPGLLEGFQFGQAGIAEMLGILDPHGFQDPGLTPVGGPWH